MFNSSIRSALFMVLGMGVSSLCDAIFKLLGEYSPFMILTVRSMILIPGILIILSKENSICSIWQVNKPDQLLRSGLMGFSVVFTILALKSLDLSEYSAVFYSSPIWIAALSIPILKEKIKTITWGPLLMGFLGVYIALDPKFKSLEITGTYFAVLDVLFFSFGMILTKKHATNTLSWVIIFWNSLVNLVIGIIGLYFARWDFHVYDLPIFFLLALLNILMNLLIIKSVSLSKLSFASIFQYSSIIWGTVLGVIFFAETPNNYFYLGVLLIIAAGYILLLSSMKNLNFLKSKKVKL